jgi:hypothetical protein
MRSLFRLAAMLAMGLVWASAQGQTPNSGPAETAAVQMPGAVEQNLDALRRSVQDLQVQLAACQAADQDEKLKKQVELLQKQIETQQKMIEMLLDHVKKQPLAGSPVEKMQTQVAALEARSKQGAQRDQELANAVDNLTEHMDATERNGPALPATLKELFLPSETNESPLSIHGVFTASYTKILHQPGDFTIDEFSPFFLLQLNQRFLLECELGFSSGGVELSQCQLDCIVNDWLTVVAGRFLVPIGFFNERMHPSWINKLPDFPLMFRQVSTADFKTNGVQLRGAHYLGDAPIKLEYAAFIGNGRQLNQQQPTLTQLADMQGFDTFDELNHNLAFGGRLGVWLPEHGLMFGVSGMWNGAYTPAAGDSFNIGSVDAGYHRGDWDLRFEYAQLFQEAGSFIGGNINRRGVWAQVAYRPYDAPYCLRNLEGVFRYGYTNFKGIDPTALDLTAFASPIDVPVNRNQYTFGVNYYFYPSLVLKVAYELNREFGSLRLKDDMFVAQLSWGF